MRVLVVEDEILIRILIVDLLEEAGYACLEAADAIEALALLDDESCQPTFLVSDFNLGPGPNGQTLAREAARRIPGLTTVFITGNPEAFDDYQFGSRERLIAKPFAGSDLIALLGELRPFAAHHVAKACSRSLMQQAQPA